MHMKISARHGHLSPETQEFIQTKAEKLPHIYEKLTSIEVTVDIKKNDKDEYFTEFLVAADHKHDFVGSAFHKDIGHAAEQALHKVEMQLRKHKERIHGHKHIMSTGHAFETVKEREDQ